MNDRKSSEHTHEYNYENTCDKINGGMKQGQPVSSVDIFQPIF